jgi:diguanylate cyclase (GGDEF)-like protein
VELEGVKNYVIGKEKTSLSWMGVPLKGESVIGVVALGSYHPNAFDSADMQLLSNLAQHITVALDNTIRHAQVEQQAQLDSMTSVYNHGYFLKKLAGQAAEASANNLPLSLIMLDIDFFKQYNDAYGHLVGDQLLMMLCAAIKQHLKQSDAVGRWGGEEFVISLPGANGVQALQIAKRISQTIATIPIHNREQQTIPVPTVSQGIAIYPTEADEIFQLIDLADRRLYLPRRGGIRSAWCKPLGKRGKTNTSRLVTCSCCLIHRFRKRRYRLLHCLVIDPVMRDQAKTPCIFRIDQHTKFFHFFHDLSGIEVNVFGQI